MTALFGILENGEIGRSYNIGGGNALSNLTVAKTVCSILDEILPARFSYENLITFVKDRPGHDKKYLVNSDFIKQDVGWSPKITFQEGIERTVHWYVKNKDWWRSEIND